VVERGLTARLSAQMPFEFKRSLRGAASHIYIIYIIYILTVDVALPAGNLIGINGIAVDHRNADL
jgi:hypothetical protein